MDYTLLGNIPEELRERPQWVCWRLERPTDRQTEKPIKIPRNYNGGARARADDPSTWGPFEAVCHEARIPRRKYSGVGFIISPDDPYVFIDLDHCVTSDGTIEPWALKIIHEIDSYTEISYSGDGIHIIARGRKPGQRCRSMEHPNIEVYDNRRFVVMTGRLVPGCKTLIENAGNEVTIFYNKLFGDVDRRAAAAGTGKNGKKPAGQSDPSSECAGALSDNELLERALRSKNGVEFGSLYAGDLSAHNYDHSAADQALCNHLAFWTNKDPEQIDALFRQSGLMRDKWNRKDYRERTINRAIADCKQTYKPRRKPTAAQSVESGGGAADPSDPANYLTDYGNAERLIAAHGENLRYDCDAGSWLTWTGTRWVEDKTGEAERLLKLTIRNLYNILPDITDTKKRDAFYRHVRNSENLARIKAALILAQTEAGIPVLSDTLDGNTWQFNCANGTVDLATGKLQPHTREHLNTKISPVAFDPDAGCPTWENFLWDIFRGDEELIAFVQRAVGYSLTGDTREQVFFILYGHGSNGKSTLITALREITGDYSMHTSTDTILDKNAGGIPNDIARLRGARLVSAIEAKAGRRLAEDLIKQLTGGDAVTARFLRQEYFEFRPQFKLWLACNHQPRIDGTDNAMWRRIRMVPFEVKYHDLDEPTGPYKDDTLPGRLRAEYPGILAWAVRGCLEWQRVGLGKPAAVVAATGKYQATMDILGNFISECCVCMPQAKCSASDLYATYCRWSELNHEKVMSQNWFGMRLSERGTYEQYRVHGRVHWRGIGLIELKFQDDRVDQVDLGDSKSGNSHVNDIQNEINRKSGLPGLPSLPSRSDQPVSDDPDDESQQKWWLE